MSETHLFNWLITSRSKLTVKDVPADAFIKAFAEYLKKTEKIVIPKWFNFVKTSCKKELSPYDPDWLYVRAASLARRIYLRKNVGI